MKKEYKKESFKPGNMLYPLPAVMVSVGDMKNSNIITVAWAGTISTNPPMLSISIRPERFSHGIILKNREFVVNLTTKKLAFATDYCGVKSGREVDKFSKLHLTKQRSEIVLAPGIKESPVNIECKLREVISLGSHDLFLADVVNITVSSEFMSETGRFSLKDANLITYSHGRYYELGKEVGSFGYSVKRHRTDKKRRRNK